MIKIIFLDIDGVLNSEKLILKLSKNNIKEYSDSGVYNFLDENIIDDLSKFCKKYKIYIVITSSWRHFYFDDTIKDLTKNKYKKLHPLIPYIIGQTPRLYKEKENGGSEQLCRGEEIKYYIDTYNIKNYVILDDDSDMLEEQMTHFIHIDNYTGLTNNNINQIKTII